MWIKISSLNAILSFVLTIAVKFLPMKLIKQNLYNLIEESWKTVLYEEFSKPYMDGLITFLNKELSLGKVIYPPTKDLFRSLKLTPFRKVKVVILGQDPYHQEGQAEGLSFSVKTGKKIPPSLKNIFKEVDENFELTTKHQTGNLQKWSNQGVLLLNSNLTVERGFPNSHSNMGWEIFTDEIIFQLNKRNNIVFLLWGNNAKEKGSKIDRSKHLVLESAHPSPLSAYRGFFGNKHFLKCNAYLQEKRIKEIDWKVN